MDKAGLFGFLPNKKHKLLGPEKSDPSTFQLSNPKNPHVFFVFLIGNRIGTPIHLFPYEIVVSLGIPRNTTWNQAFFGLPQSNPPWFQWEQWGYSD